MTTELQSSTAQAGACPAPTAAGLPRLEFRCLPVREDLAVGAPVGDLAVRGGFGQYAFTLPACLPAGLLDLTGSRLRLTSALDAAATPNIAALVEASNGTDPALALAVNVAVVGVAETAVPTPTPTSTPTPNGTRNTIVSSSGFTNTETRPLRAQFTLARPGSPYLRGQDMNRVEFTTLQPAQIIEMRWLNDGVKNFDAPDDFNRDKVYDIQIVIPQDDGTEVVADMPVSLADLQTEPAKFSFASVDNAEPNSTHQASTITISGLAPGYAAPVTATAPYVKNGGAPTSASGTVVNGDTLSFAPVTASPSYSTALAFGITVSTTEARFRVTTKADPAAPQVVATAAVPTSADEPWATVQSWSVETPRPALLFALRWATSRNAPVVKVDGVAVTPVMAAPNDMATYLVATPGSSVNVEATWDFGPSERAKFLALAISNLDSLVPTATATKAAGYGGNPSTTDADLLVEARGTGVAIMNGSNPRPHAGVEVARLPAAGDANIVAVTYGPGSVRPAFDDDGARGYPFTVIHALSLN